jgi:hypothetical protein
MMWNKRQSRENQQSLFFKRWTRKSYAVFASLGRWVKISVLQTGTADRLAAKSHALLQVVVCIILGIERDGADDVLTQDDTILFAMQLIPLTDTISQTDSSQSINLSRFFALKKCTCSITDHVHFFYISISLTKPANTSSIFFTDTWHRHKMAVSHLFKSI